MSPHNGRIDEQLLEVFGGAVLYPLPKAFPEVALFPSAEALVDGVPVPELIGQVAPWGTGACLVEDGFDEHPVAEDRGAAGGVFEFAQDRLDFGPDSIRDK